MHTLTLVTLELPEIEADSKTDLNIEKEIERLTAESKKKPDNIMLSFSIEQLNSLKNAFARAISSALSDKMDYYAQDPKNSDYLEFEDYTEEIKETYIKNAKYYTDIDNGILTIMGSVCGCGEIKAKAMFEGKPMGEATIKVNNSVFTMQIKLSELHLWELGKGRLYDLALSFGEDRVKSYFGMRSVRLDGMKFMLNNKSVFQRLVLDQGYYPDGIYTAKTDDELKRDIELSMKLGFNGARLHEKVFEKRFLYHCDKAG